MDNYWYPFGYRGVTNFCEIKLPVKQVILFKTTSEARQVSKADINLLAVWYRDTYHGLLGFMERDNAIWEYHLARCNDQSLPIKIIKCKDQFIGYYFLRDNIVLEAGFNKDYKNEVFQHLVHEIKELGYMEIIFKTGKSHPLITIISRYEHSFYTRYVWKGGHIARIRSVFDFLNKIKPVLVQRIKNVNVNGFDFSCNSIRFAYTGNNLVISEYGVTDPDISFEQAEWVKLIFGVIPPTCLIRYKGDKYTSLLAILFPLCDTQFPELDHF